ncbi:metal-dependent hydrolase [Pseudoteredinibacter isoporae]|uniref:metal-dependent hydrolase n=1 Tax=Pseudoteredinibacter isoporae TaxID=570281 RepID=UPI003107911E
MNSINVRQPNFVFEDDLALMPDPDDSLYSAFSCSVTILAPHIERFLIRVMRTCSQNLEHGALRDSVIAFCGQEAKHLDNHDRLNEVLRTKLSDAGRQKLLDAEAELQGDYDRFFKEKETLFNLAYAEGFESATCAISLWAFEHNTLRHSQKPWRDIIEWHLAEEIEHRCVAYDVYHAMGGSYRHRLLWGCYGQWHLYRYLRLFGSIFLNEFPEREQKRNVLKQRGLSLLKKWMVTLGPSYSPEKIKLPEGLDNILSQYEYSRRVDRV